VWELWCQSYKKPKPNKNYSAPCAVKKSKQKQISPFQTKKVRFKLWSMTTICRTIKRGKDAVECQRMSNLRWKKSPMIHSSGRQGHQDRQSRWGHQGRRTGRWQQFAGRSNVVRMLQSVKECQISGEQSHRWSTGRQDRQSRLRPPRPKNRSRPEKRPK
jgi:hypothetical protein